MRKAEGRQEDRRVRLPRYGGGHRQPHHHDQRPGGAGLGRGRHRGGSGDAGPAHLHADSRSHRLQAHRQIARRRHRHRPGADRDPDAAQEGRGGQIRGILRPGPRRDVAGRPRHHRQHGAGIWRDLRLLPHRCRDRALPEEHRAQARPRRAGGKIRQGAGPVPHRQERRSGLHRHAVAGHDQRRAVHGRSDAAAGPRGAVRHRRQFRRGPDDHLQEGRRRQQARQAGRHRKLPSAMAMW